MKTSYARVYNQWHRPNTKTVHHTSLILKESATSIDSDCCCLPTASVLSNKADGITLQSGLMNKPEFLKATRFASHRFPTADDGHPSGG